MLSPNGWMNKTLTAEWFKQIWGPPQTNKRMLVWDSYKCQISASIKKAVQNTNTVMAVVPGGCTKLFQPADVSWNAPFKAAYRKLYDTWLASGTMERTRGGNLHASSKALRVQWVLEAWDSIGPQIIYKSFEVSQQVTHHLYIAPNKLEQPILSIISCSNGINLTTLHQEMRHLIQMTVGRQQC